MAAARSARRAPSLAYEAVFFVALLATAVALGGALAHLFELPNKIGLSHGDYFTVQKAYRGWNRLAYVLLVEFGSMVALAVLSRRRRAVLWPVLAAILGLIGAQAVFWIFTYPANVATRNWTVAPENWEQLRDRWEYSHAVGAGFQLFAMAALIIALLAHSRR